MPQQPPLIDPLDESTLMREAIASERSNDERSSMNAYNALVADVGEKVHNTVGVEHNSQRFWVSSLNQAVGGPRSKSDGITSYVTGGKVAVHVDTMDAATAYMNYINTEFPGKPFAQMQHSQAGFYQVVIPLTTANAMAAQARETLTKPAKDHSDVMPQSSTQIGSQEIEKHNLNAMSQNYVGQVIQAASTITGQRTGITAESDVFERTTFNMAGIGIAETRAVRFETVPSKTEAGYMDINITGLSTQQLQQYVNYVNEHYGEGAAHINANGRSAVSLSIAAAGRMTGALPPELDKLAKTNPDFIGDMQVQSRSPRSFGNELGNHRASEAAVQQPPSNRVSVDLSHDVQHGIMLAPFYDAAGKKQPAILFSANNMSGVVSIEPVQNGPNKGRVDLSVQTNNHTQHYFMDAADAKRVLSTYNFNEDAANQQVAEYNKLHPSNPIPLVRSASPLIHALDEWAQQGLITPSQQPFGSIMPGTPAFNEFFDGGSNRTQGSRAGYAALKQPDLLQPFTAPTAGTVPAVAVGPTSLVDGPIVAKAISNTAHSMATSGMSKTQPRVQKFSV
jgi:hypothetical protein